MGRIRDAWAALTAREVEVPPEFRVHPGVYRHYKGGKYLTFGLAHDANVPGRTVVVYVGLDTAGAHEGPRLAVRTLHEDTACEGARPDGYVPHADDFWLDEVPTVFGDARYDLGARPVPRFRWLGPTYEAWMSGRH